MKNDSVVAAIRLLVSWSRNCTESGRPKFITQRGVTSRVVFVIGSITLTGPRAVLSSRVGELA